VRSAGRRVPETLAERWRSLETDPEGFHFEEAVDGLRVEGGEGIALLVEDPALLVRLARREAGREGLYLALLPWRRIPDPGGERLWREDGRAEPGAVPAVAAPDAVLLRPGDADLHRLLAAIGRNGTLSRPGPSPLPAHSHLLTPEEAARAYAHRPAAVENAIALAESCRWTPPTDLVLPTFRPGVASSRAAEEALARLRALSEEGVRRRYGDVPLEVRARLER
jgi:hypothetical protein